MTFNCCDKKIEYLSELICHLIEKHNDEEIEEIIERVEIIEG